MVDETDIRNVKLGQPAEVRVDALEGLKIKGEVTEIGSSAIVRGTSQTAGQQTATGNTANQAKDFKVTITLKDPPARAAPGPERHRRHRRSPARRRCWPLPIQAVVVRELDKDGKVVDPDAVKPAESSPRTTPWWTPGRSRSRRRTASSW